MKEVLRANDPVLLSWVVATLEGEGIPTLVLDTHTSILEGSINAIQPRVMVGDDDHARAERILAQARADGYHV